MRYIYPVRDHMQIIYSLIFSDRFLATNTVLMIDWGYRRTLAKHNPLSNMGTKIVRRGTLFTSIL